MSFRGASSTQFHVNITKFPRPAKRVPKKEEWDAIEDFCNDNRPQDSAEITVSDSPAGGKAMGFANGGIGGGGSATAQQPWTILPGDDPETVKVGPNSSLMETFTTEMSIADKTDSFEVGVDELLYIHIEYPAMTATLVAGAPWTDYPEVFNYTGSGPYTITDAYFLIAYGALPENAEGLQGVTITPDPGDPWKVVRCCFTPLVIDWVNPGGGFVFRYPRPHIRPGPVIVP